MSNVIDLDQPRAEILEAIKGIKAKAGIQATSDGRAPQYAHDMLDAMLSAKAGSGGGGVTIKAAPGWAHALLDLIWDLF